MTGDLDIVSAILRALRLELVPSMPLPTSIRVVDRRGVKRKVSVSSSKPRDPATIRSVLLHQMDVELGLRGYQIKAAGGDRTEALIRRAMGQPYHAQWLCGAGVVLLNHDFALRTSHADSGNGAVGLAIEGTFPMTAAERKATHTPLERVIEGGRAALREVVRQLRAAGAGALELQAHRQFAPGRLRDPGGEIWTEIGLPVARELDLTVNYQLAREGGRPIPDAWDPAAIYDLAGEPT